MHQCVLASGLHWLASFRNSWPNRMEGSVTKPAKELVTKPSRRQLPERMELSPLEAVHFLIRLPGHGAVSSVVRLHSARNQGVGVGIAFLTLTITCRIFASHSSKCIQNHSKENSCRYTDNGSKYSCKNYKIRRSNLIIIS